MADITTSANATINAPASVVYAILADYKHHHQWILPKRYFSPLYVERGGCGEGTIISFQMNIGGAKRDVRMEVTEPRPGHTLSERDFATGAVTTFVVEPLDGGTQSQVTITTQWTTPGFTGLIEKLFAPSTLRKIYHEELGNLAELAESMVAVEEFA